MRHAIHLRQPLAVLRRFSFHGPGRPRPFSLGRYGKWGYAFARGSYNNSERDYEHALQVPRAVISS